MTKSAGALAVCCLTVLLLPLLARAQETCSEADANLAQLRERIENQTIAIEGYTYKVPSECDQLTEEQRTHAAVGVHCETWRGVRFERVSDPGHFEDTWLDTQTGLIWSNYIGQFTHQGKAVGSLIVDSPAASTCAKLGARLPTWADFEKGEKHGMRDVLPNMKHWYWSSSVLPGNENSERPGNAVVYKSAVGVIQNDRLGLVDNAVLCVRSFRPGQPDPVPIPDDPNASCESKAKKIEELKKQLESLKAATEKARLKWVAMRVKPDESCNRWPRDQQDSVPVGSQCRTSWQFTVLKRVDDPDFGPSWLDTKTHLVWSDDLGWYTNEGSAQQGLVESSPAQDACKRLNSRLPTRDDFRLAFEADDLGEVLHSHETVNGPSWGPQSPPFWTASIVSSSDEKLAYRYSRLTGFYQPIDRTTRARTRCVKDSGASPQ